MAIKATQGELNSVAVSIATSLSPYPEKDIVWIKNKADKILKIFEEVQSPDLQDSKYS